MKGLPKRLNSREDYDNIIDDFGYTSQVKDVYQALLNTDKHYVFDKQLVSESDRTGPAQDYIVMTEENQDGTEKIVQYKLVDNPDSKMKQLGFTETEVQEVIDKCSA